MSQPTKALPVLCPVCDVFHTGPAHHCLSCGHALCWRCQGCHCDTIRCDCRYGRQE